ncbi:hypothetical protein ACH5Y9_09525 [Methylomonas sp. BW4-1]
MSPNSKACLWTRIVKRQKSLGSLRPSYRACGN